MPEPRASLDEIARRGEEIYERDLRARVEPAHIGDFLVVDVDTGDYEVDPDEVVALKRAYARHPEGSRYLIRVGYLAAHQIGGSLMDARR